MPGRTYKEACSLTENLKAFGFSHRKPDGGGSDSMGRREICDAKTGQAFGTMDYFEAADMLKRIEAFERMDDTPAQPSTEDCAVVSDSHDPAAGEQRRK